MAEGEGFELSELLDSVVFKTTAIDHSANLPYNQIEVMGLEPMDAFGFSDLGTLLQPQQLYFRVITPYPHVEDTPDFLLLQNLATQTGLEPVTSCVTGM